MEKRRLLLVVMLLATSGAVLASEPLASGGDTDGDTSTQQRGKARRGAHKVAKRTRGFFLKIGKVFTLKLGNAHDAYDEGSYGNACLQVAAVPGAALLDMSPSDLLPCLQEGPSSWVALGQTGVTIGLGVALYKTAKNKRVQDSVKGFIRGVRRSLSFRKKALEKRTDGEKIEAEQAA